MALFECPECGGKVSDKATQCPHCGCPIEKPHKQSKTCPECGQEVDASVMVCPNCALPFSRTKTNGKVDKHSNTTNTDNQNGKRIVDRNQSECPLCKSIIYKSDERCPVCGITAHLRDLIKRAAEDATAANELGRSYELGNDIMMDYSKALYWYKQAAKKGNVDGMVNLARLYAGWNEDTIKAKHWCDEAVRNGREDAYTQVGNELKKRGQDKKAVCWYNKDLGFEIQKQREQKEARKKRKENRKQSNGRLFKPSIYAIAVSLVCVIVYFCFFNDPSLKIGSGSPRIESQATNRFTTNEDVLRAIKFKSFDTDFGSVDTDDNWFVYSGGQRVGSIAVEEKSGNSAIIGIHLDAGVGTIVVRYKIYTDGTCTKLSER